MAIKLFTTEEKAWQYIDDKYDDEKHIHYSVAYDYDDLQFPEEMSGAIVWMDDVLPCIDVCEPNDLNGYHPIERIAHLRDNQKWYEVWHGDECISLSPDYESSLKCYLGYEEFEREGEEDYNNGRFDVDQLDNVQLICNGEVLKEYIHPALNK